MFNTSAICRLLDSQKPVNGTKELIHQVFIADKNYIVRKPKQPYQQNELEWFITQSRNIEDLKSIAGFIPKIWEDIAEKDGTVNSNYGWCCLSKENGSQFWNAMKHLELDKHSRRAIMIYNRPTMHTDWIANRGNYNLKWQHKTPDAYKDLRGDFMCCQNNHFLIRDNKLEMTVHMRSLDALFGYNADYIWFDWIFNKAVQYLKKTYPELKRGDMVIYADSVHVYERHFEDLEKEANFGAEDPRLFEVAPNRRMNNPYLLDPENNASVASSYTETIGSVVGKNFMNKNKPLGCNDSIMKESNKDMVNHPDHYTQNDMEHADFVEYMGYPYTLGCATKYVFRNRFKGTQNQDLDKVVAYCELYLKTDDAIVSRLFNSKSIPEIALKGLTNEELDLLKSINTLFVFSSESKYDPVMEAIRIKVKKLKI